MTLLRDIIACLEEAAPSSLAEEWDNVGLLVGDKNAEVKRILLCMDITTGSVREAVSKKADLIISHHPVLFKSVKRIVAGEGKGSLIHEIIKNNINVFAAHTNLDYAENGVNTRLAEVIGLKDCVVLGNGPGRVGVIDRAMSLDEFARKVKSILVAPAVRVIGEPEKEVRRIAVFSGSFDNNINDVLASGADVLVTGDVKYHTALDAAEEGLCIIDAGHFYTEKIVLKPVAESLRLKFSDVEVFLFEGEKDPFRTI